MCKKRKQKKINKTKTDRRKGIRQFFDWTFYFLIFLIIGIAFIATPFMTSAYNNLKYPSTFSEEIEDIELGINEYWTLSSFHIDDNYTLTFLFYSFK